MKKVLKVTLLLSVLASCLLSCSHLFEDDEEVGIENRGGGVNKTTVDGREVDSPHNASLEDVLKDAGLTFVDTDSKVKIKEDTSGNRPAGFSFNTPTGVKYVPVNDDGTLDYTGLSDEDKKIPLGTAIKSVLKGPNENILTYTITDVNGNKNTVPVKVDGASTTSAEWSKIKTAAASAGVNVETAPGGSTVIGWNYSSNSNYSSSNTATNDTSIDGGSYIEPTLTAKYSVNDGSETKPASFDNFKYSDGGKTLKEIFANANGGNTSADKYQAPSKANTPKGYGFTGWKVTTPDGTVKVVEPSKIGTDTTKYPAGTKIEPNWKPLHVARLPNNETMEFTEFTRTSDGFYIANTEVTRGQWLAVMGPDSNESDEYSRWGFVQKTGHAGALDMPMNNISWFEAIVFCNKMSMLNNLKPYYYLKIGDVNETNPDKWGTKPKLYYDFDRNGFTKNEHKNITGDYYWNKEPNTGWNHINHDWDNIKEEPSANGYRLPTLEQWKFAAKGGEGAPYSTYSGTTGTDEEALKKVAWYTANSDSSVQKVGEKGGDNPVRDMTGNVWEWLWDHDSSNNRLFHGGAYNATVGDCNIGKTPLGYNAPHTATQGIGFRIIEPIIK